MNYSSSCSRCFFPIVFIFSDFHVFLLQSGHGDLKMSASIAWWKDGDHGLARAYIVLQLRDFHLSTTYHLLQMEQVSKVFVGYRLFLATLVARWLERTNAEESQTYLVVFSRGGENSYINKILESGFRDLRIVRMMWVYAPWTELNCLVLRNRFLLSLMWSFTGPVELL